MHRRGSRRLGKSLQPAESWKQALEGLVRLPSLRRVGTGSMHTLLLSGERVLSCGLNNFGQLGLGVHRRPDDCEEQATPWRYADEPPADHQAHTADLQEVVSLSELDDDRGPGKSRIVSVGAGGGHSFALTDRGRLFTWGRGPAPTSVADSGWAALSAVGQPWGSANWVDRDWSCCQVLSSVGAGAIHTGT